MGLFGFNAEKKLKKANDYLPKGIYYDAKVAFRQFAETVKTGCGPGCGTEAAAGFCGTTGSSCISCAAHGACKSTR